jgi:hypothetical protein
MASLSANDHSDGAVATRGAHTRTDIRARTRAIAAEPQRRVMRCQRGRTDPQLNRFNPSNPALRSLQEDLPARVGAPR